MRLLTPSDQERDDILRRETELLDMLDAKVSLVTRVATFVFVLFPPSHFLFSFTSLSLHILIRQDEEIRSLQRELDILSKDKVVITSLASSSPIAPLT